MSKRAATFIIHLALVPMAFLALAIPAMTMDPVGGWIGDPSIAQETLEQKPSNHWKWTAEMAQEFPACVDVMKAPADALAVAHIVVTDHDAVVRMDQAQVADRLEVFGGTARTSDDVKVVGSCY